MSVTIFTCTGGAVSWIAPISLKAYTKLLYPSVSYIIQCCKFGQQKIRLWLGHGWWLQRQAACLWTHVRLLVIWPRKQTRNQFSILWLFCDSWLPREKIIVYIRITRITIIIIIIIIIIMNFYSPVSNTRCHSIGHKMRMARIKSG